MHSSIHHSTFVIERSYSATPERVFAAFADPAKKRRWFRDGEENETLEFEMDFRPGGAERSLSTIKSGPFQGTTLTNRTVYQDIVPGERIVFAYTMELGEKRISASLASVELFAKDSGCHMIFTEQSAFFKGADGPEMREAGWRSLLERLNLKITEA